MASAPRAGAILSCCLAAELPIPDVRSSIIFEVGRIAQALGADVQVLLHLV